MLQFVSNTIYEVTKMAGRVSCECQCKNPLYLFINQHDQCCGIKIKIPVSMFHYTIQAVMVMDTYDVCLCNTLL